MLAAAADAAALAEAFALADAEALAEVFAEAEAEAEAEVFTEVATGVGFALGLCVVAAAFGTMSAVAGVGEVLGEWLPIVIAAATPPGPPTTVPARAATVIAGYFRVQDWLASERTIGLLRLCLA